MDATRTALHRAAATQAGLRLGERVRQLRIAAGLTQTELAGDRFSKEYVSQIERGKTRPTRETVEWIAQQLGVDASFLESGVSADERGRVEAVLARAETLVENHEHEEALEEFARMNASMLTKAIPELQFRSLIGAAWARMSTGQVREAIDLLTQARELAEQDVFTDLDRAEVLFRLGACRFNLSSISTAIGLFKESLTLAERSGLPCDLLRSRILQWRSRCYRRLRDWEAAREDIEHALELAQGLKDLRAIADVYAQASLITERNGQYVLARTYSEKAKACYEQLNDRRNEAYLLNNLAGITFLLGKPDQAIESLKQALAMLVDVGTSGDMALVVASLAEVYLGKGEVALAEEQARKALDLYGEREDRLDQIGTTQLTLGRALLQQDRLDEAEAQFALADATFEQASSVSHRAAVWVAQGDLAAKRGDETSAARLYRRAAEALQDFRF